MSSRVSIRRLATGVPGLDTVLGGGLPEFSFNLIAGPPGSGKTTLAHQMMFGLATKEKPALFFTVLGETPLKMLRYQQQFKFFDLTKVNDCIRFVDLSDEVATGRFEQVLSRISDEVAATAPGLVFVDSLRSVRLESSGAPLGSISLQQFIQELGMLLSSWQTTTFLVGEAFSESDPHPVFSVADGLLLLDQSVHGNSMVRKLQIMKMRGQATSPGMHTFRISDAGIDVYPAATGREDPSGPSVRPPAPVEARLTMGVPRLDEMLGGGLPAGYSLLVAGPSGSGKTILATAFLSEGARLGQHGVLVAFEQTPSQSRNHTIDNLVRGGHLSLINTRSLDLSIDEIVQHLLTLIHDHKQVTRVVIDSLSGFELAVAPTFREDFRESLFRMVSALSGLGVTVLMTSELEDRYTDLRFSPYGSAFLTDAIIVQRYIEVESRLRRVMAVVKVRSSAHSNEVRQFEIDDRGIVIGDMVRDYEGLLGGRPTRLSPGQASSTPSL
jgi:circadian clock protein KaiC